MSRVVGYRSGSNRVTYKEPAGRSHTYAMTAAGGLWPMCDYGWNRSNGARFSIFRGSPGTEGACKICKKNVAEKRRPLICGRPHKTKYL